MFADIYKPRTFSSGGERFALVDLALNYRHGKILK
jgi:hypothetical protein